LRRSRRRRDSSHGARTGRAPGRGGAIVIASGLRPRGNFRTVTLRAATAAGQIPIRGMWLRVEIRVFNGPGGRKAGHRHPAKRSRTTGWVPICLSWRAVRAKQSPLMSYREIASAKNGPRNDRQGGEPRWLRPNHRLLHRTGSRWPALRPFPESNLFCPQKPLTHTPIQALF